jgi:hypothetical protein
MAQAPYPKPLTSAKVSRLQPLRPQADSPASVKLSLGTFRSPEGAKAAIVPIEGSPDYYRVEIDLPDAALGQRTPQERIPTIRLDRNKLKASAVDRVAPDGLRPSYLPVDFVPTRVRLPLTQRARPPFDFEYPAGVDRPTNVFAPDQRLHLSGHILSMVYGWTS